MYKFFNYSGSKAYIKYIKFINDFLEDKDRQIYIEPFVGSGGVLFNLEKKFERYIINDADRNIIRIYKSFGEISNYGEYSDIVNDVFNEFGEFVIDGRYCSELVREKTKNNYYNFRNWFNKNQWCTDSFEEGIYLHILASSCLNSFLRFGKNGMNQSFGNRFHQFPKPNFDKITSIIKKCEIYNEDYSILLRDEFNDEGFFFLDPPYHSQDSSYLGFDIDSFLMFLERVKKLNCYIYTDILNEYNDFFEHKYFIQNMKNTSPNRKENKTINDEYMFTSSKYVYNYSLENFM